MENWWKVKEFITPGNLIKLGNVRYSTLAACLDLLEYYSNNLADLRDEDIKVQRIIWTLKDGCFAVYLSIQSS